MQQYTIQIRTNNPANNEPPFSAYCQELELSTDDFSIAAALSGLFSAIEIIEERQRNRVENMNYLEPNQIFSTFSVPVAA